MESLRQKVLEHFATLPDVDYGNHFDFQLPTEARYFVKYGTSEDLVVEAETQKYFYHLAQQDDLAPRIPRIYDVFNTFRRYFVVMEYVAGQTLESAGLSEADAASVATFAVRWLLNQEPPSDAVGTVAMSESGRAQHCFFKDNQAPYAFASVQALQTYVNKALSRLPPPYRTATVSFESMPCVIYHSDIKKNNFLVDANHRVWMIDFEHVGVLPLPFRQFAFYNVDNAFAAAVGRALNVERAEHQALMVRASNLLQMYSDASLGLDRFGNPVPRVSPTVRERSQIGISRDGGPN